MSKTYKDKPGYLSGIKKKKEEYSQEYLRHRNRDDENWRALYEENLALESNLESKHYRCIERKMPIFNDDMDWAEDLIDSLDDLNDKENDAA